MQIHIFPTTVLLHLYTGKWEKKWNQYQRQHEEDGGGGGRAGGVDGDAGGSAMTMKTAAVRGRW